jgi:hypothetical protein
MRTPLTQSISSTAGGSNPWHVYSVMWHLRKMLNSSVALHHTYVQNDSQMYYVLYWVRVTFHPCLLRTHAHTSARTHKHTLADCHNILRAYTMQQHPPFMSMKYEHCSSPPCCWTVCNIGSISIFRLTQWLKWFIKYCIKPLYPT